jgi:histidyl-tRNA synthetase
MRPISSSLSAKPLLNMTTNLAVREKTARMQLKTPKGTRDWTGPDIGMRDRIFASATEVFRRHAAVALDTPVFELKEILVNTAKMPV